MKKLGIFVLLSYITVFGEELIIEKQKEFQVELEPNIYKSGFSLSVEKYEQEKIEQIFQKAIGIVKEYPICKGGQYNINPHYKKNSFTGYIHFNCSFSNVSLYEELLDKVKTVDGKLSQNRIQLANSDDLIEDAQIKLEKKALSFPKGYTLFLQESLQERKCIVSHISFQKRPGNTTPYLLRSAESVNSKVTSPVEEKLKHTLNVGYVFKCKSK